MSVLHFPGSEQSRKRIIQMGEFPDRVFNVGDTGVENCLRLEKFTRADLAKILNFKGLMGNYAVVTFHPVTMEENTAEIQIRELISAMDDFPDLSYIITMANADAGGRIINEIWQTASKNRENWLVVPSLGVKKYLSAVIYSKVVIGNSSSGVIEVPVLKIPTVNIGDRQKGREMADSVISCRPIRSEISESINRAISKDFQSKVNNMTSPFVDGWASEKIVHIILDFLNQGNECNKKGFYDINFIV